jgi:TonB-dependent starch-binding outer membrane protein SusC
MMTLFIFLLIWQFSLGLARTFNYVDMRKFTQKVTLVCSVWLLAFAGMLSAQNATVSGTVFDENNEPFVGATVVLEGTNYGAMSDAEGNYAIEGVKPGDYTLVVNYLSYDKFQQVIKVAGSEQMIVNINMKLKVMDDVIIVGYGTERKRDMTGSISKISNRELNDVPGASFDATLQGKAAGVQVIQGSGIAGAGAKITVRGAGSISAGGDPLYVIDGIPVTQDPFLNGDRGGQNNNPLSSINPADIESIEILKDAAAAAIYGSRGANGVILVTTKRGKTGKPTFNFTARTGISRPAKLLEFLSTEEWVQLNQEAWENDGHTGQDSTLPGNFTPEQALANGNTDWQRQTIGTGIKQEYNLSMSQGTEKLKTYIDVSAMNTESYLIGNSYRRYTGRVNLDWNVLKNLKVGVSASGSYGRNNKISQAWEGSLGTAQSTALPFYTTDAPNSAFGYPGNPINRRTSIDWRTIEKRTINTLNLQYQPIKNLTINANGSLDYMDLGDYQHEDTVWTNTVAYAKNNYSKVVNWNTNATAKYDFAMLPSNHRLSLMVGSEAQKMTRHSGFYQVSDIAEQLYQDWTPGDQSDTVDTENALDAWSFVSFFGRVNYELNNKYILKASLRVDGSSKFGRNNRYGYFPAVGAGWVISEENFWKDHIKAVNFFKLKASFGVTGNADIPSFLRFGTFSGLNNNIQYNNDSIIFPIRLENPDLSWETTQTIDAGFEIGLLKDRITAEVAVYNKESRDVLLQTATPSSSGFKTYWQNIGHVRNRGAELGITTFNINGALKWKTTLNIARNRNLVVDVGTTPPDALAGSGDTRVVPGQPIGVNYLVRFDHVDAATGKPVYLDKNGNETMEWRTENRVVVGNVQAQAQGGLRNSFEYKGFDLNFLVTFTIGGKIYDDAAKRQFGVFTDWNMRRELLNRWTHPGQTDAQYPRLTQNPATYGLDNEWNYNTTLWLYDASYARLKNVTLGYNFKLNSEKAFLQKLRVYAAATNLLTLTKYPGSDPEIVRDQSGPQGRNISPNVTYLTPPQERTVSLGVDLQF